MTLEARQVVVVRTSEASYPSVSPFSPSENYPEYAGQVSHYSNGIYPAVRECWRVAGLDSANYGTPNWNPLSDLIQPGDKVVLKPNLVKEKHPRDPAGWRYVLTHGSVIRAVADYAFKAVGPSGRVTVADAPQTDSSFQAVVERLGLPELRDYYAQQSLEFELIDLRREEWTNVGGVIVQRRRLSGDPRGAVAFDLASLSEFVGHPGEGHYYGADYDISEVNGHHSDGKHEYLLARTVMDADVVFSLPKMKTHKKAGVTLTLKNLVGVNADKNWLPHHTEGPPSQGGDERPGAGPRERIERGGVRALHRLLVRAPVLGRPLARVARRGGTRVFGDTEEVIRSGNWYGNDTVWRMSLDLNKLLLYGNADGSISPSPVRRHFSLVDGVVGGQRRGPMNPDPLESRTLIFGIDPPSVDATCTRLMGFDVEKIPTVANAFRCASLPLARHAWREVEVLAVDGCHSIEALPAELCSPAEPHYAWLGHIEAT